MKVFVVIDESVYQMESDVFVKVSSNYKSAKKYFDDTVKESKENDDYWCAFLGPGGEIWDDPSYENFSNGETTNLDRCEELLEFGDWVDTRNFNKSSGVVM